MSHVQKNSKLYEIFIKFKIIRLVAFRACYEKNFLSPININCAKFASCAGPVIIRLFIADVIIICISIFFARRIVALINFSLVRPLKLDCKYDLDFIRFV